MVEYDADSHDLRTVSLHVFEDEAMRSGYYHNHSAPFVRVDPENRDELQSCSTFAFNPSNQFKREIPISVV